MRKNIIIAAAGALVALAAVLNTFSCVAKSKKEVGLQLYSIRELIGDADKFAKNGAQVMAQLAEMGYTHVETANYSDGKIYGLAPAEFRAVVEKAGLKTLSTHTTHFISDEEKASGNFAESLKWWKQCIADHKAAGMSYIVAPSMPIPGTLKELKVWCDYYNQVGKLCAESGMKFGYHNHSGEFQKIEDKVMLDFMLENTDARYVFFQLDVYWTVIGKASPVEYFKRYPGRFTLLHIKDYKEIGQSGMVGFDAIYKNADFSGVKYNIVELEATTSGNIMQGVKESIDYLLKADFVKKGY